MPTYCHYCESCAHEFDHVRPVAEFDNKVRCPECHDEAARVMKAPVVMKVALPDGTRRFDSVRKYRDLERAKKAETDKKRKSKISEEMDKVIGIGGSK